MMSAIASQRIVSGAQIRAARAMLGWRRDDLAAAAAVNTNTVVYWEMRSSIPSGESGACKRIREALHRAGVVLFEAPAPGVRFASLEQ